MTTCEISSGQGENGTQVDFREREEAKHCFEAGFEAAMHAKEERALTEAISDTLDHHRQDENHRP